MWGLQGSTRCRVKEAEVGYQISMLLGWVRTEMTGSCVSVAPHSQVYGHVQESCTQLALNCCCPSPPFILLLFFPG